MKLISLNVWGGKVYESLIEFIQKQANTIDILCFQEVLFGSEEAFTPLVKARINIFSEIQKLLTGYTVLKYFAPKEATYFQRELLPENTRPGLAIFVKNSLSIINHGGFRGYHGNYPAGADFGGKITGNCQWVRLRNEISSEYTVLNVHGLWQRGTYKADTPERVIQSKILNKFLNSQNAKKILCGDLNLKPDTESIKILEQGMTNLIKKYKINATRSKLYPYPERFADYIFVSPDITVNRFEVLQDEVSDHLPLLLDFK